MPPLPFILCADDFGFSPGVSEGILDLASKHRLSAVSCMVTQAGFRDGASALKSHADHLDIGIHLVLTDARALSPDLGQLPSMRALITKAMMGQLNGTDIKNELARQLTTFSETFGQPPDFVDSHHHVHQLPGIRDIVLELIDEQFVSYQPYLRSCFERPAVLLGRGVAPFKAAALSVMGAALNHRAEARKIPVIDGFSGIYDLSGKTPYGQLFDRFTNSLRPKSLIMCHPGKVDDELTALDSLTDQREVELAYFSSDEFRALLSRKNLCLGRFTATPE